MLGAILMGAKVLLGGVMMFSLVIALGGAAMRGTHNVAARTTMYAALAVTVYDTVAAGGRQLHTVEGLAAGGLAAGWTLYRNGVIG